MHVLLEGRVNGTMPSWKQLSDVELAAVLTYVKNNWSNHTGEAVQPAQFTAARAGKFPEGGTAAPAAPAAPAPGAAAEPVASVAAQSYQVFFATGQGSLDDQALATVRQAAQQLAAQPNVKIVLSGFVDATGSAQVNAELAKQRAQAVAKALTEAGIAPERLELRKPETITDSAGASDQARRVDILAAQ